MAKKILLVLPYMILSLLIKGQNDRNFGGVDEVVQFANYFEKSSDSFFQTSAAKDSIIALLQNKLKIISATKNKQIDSEKIVFNRIVLSLDLFFSANQIEAYAFDSVYCSVPYLKRIYTLYLNYPSKNINSFTSQEGVALMYQSELYLYFNKNETYLKNIKLLFDGIQRFYQKEEKSGILP